MKNLNIALDMNDTLASVPNLEYRALALSTEGISDFVTNIATMFTDRIKTVSEIFTLTSSKLDTPNMKDLTIQGKNLYKINNDVITIAQKGDYSKLEAIKIPGIIGLNVDFLTLTNNMQPILESINANMITMLANADTVISKMISDANYRTSFSPKIGYKNFEEIVAMPEIFINSIIDPKVKTDITTVRAMIPNITSITTIYKNLQSNNNVFNYKLFLDMKELTIKLSEKSDTLYNLFVNQDIDKATRQSLIELGGNLEYIAKYVTSATSVFYLLNQTNDIFSATVKILKQKI